MHIALLNFSNDTRNKVIKRSVSIVSEAEKSGGSMDEVLDAVTSSVIDIKKMREERRASVYSQQIQGYIVFFIFIAIMLVLQAYLLPKISDIATGLMGPSLGGSTGGLVSEGVKIQKIGDIFIWLIMIQGFFAGLMIGKFSEGSVKYGIKHALILCTVSYILITTVVGVKKPEAVAMILPFLWRFRK